MCLSILSTNSEKITHQTNRSLWTAVLFIIGMAVLDPAAARAGDGRMGPQTSGDSIPVQVDRAITISELFNVVQSCDLKLATNLATQLWRVNDVKTNIDDLPKFELLKVTDNGTIKTLFNTTASFHQLAVDPNTGITHDQFFGFDKILTFQGNHGPESQRMDLTFCVPRGPSINCSMGNLGQRTHLYSESQKGNNIQSFRPKFVFDQQIAESSYDNLGNLIQERILVKNPVIKLPTAGLQPLNDFVNFTTGIKTKITVNVEEYAMCLLSGIQK
jgi:hypothetical protein